MNFTYFEILRLSTKPPMYNIRCWKWTELIYGSNNFLIEISTRNPFFSVLSCWHLLWHRYPITPSWAIEVEISTRKPKICRDVVKVNHLPYEGWSDIGAGWDTAVWRIFMPNASPFQRYKGSYINSSPVHEIFNFCCRRSEYSRELW